MPVSLGLSSLVNAAGALLFAIEGVVILVLARGERRGMLMGGLATAFGLAYVFQNLLVYDGTIALGLPFPMCALATAGFALALARDFAAELPRGQARSLAIFAALTAIAYFVVSFQIASLGGLAAGAGVLKLDVLGKAVIMGSAFVESSLLVLLATVGLRLRMLARESERELRATGALALAFGSWLFFIVMWRMSIVATTRNDILTSAYLAAAALAIVAILTFLPAPSSRSSPTARVTMLALLASGLVGLFMGPTFRFGTDFGAFGIVRTFGAALLAIAVFKFDLLGVPLPRIAVQRGALAAGALATLLIVAQVAQNFFSAEFGLLTGGIVAGAFLFAASPLQRAIESMRAPERAAIVSQPVSGDDKRVATYRDAVRYALRDGVVTRKEEAHLADLAQHLGIGAGDAMRIRHEVEDERANG